MLPFLKNKNDKAGQTGIIVKNRAPDEKPEQDQDDPSAAIRACSRALIDAVHRSDEQGVADALSDAFEILGSKADDEADQPEPHSYDAQNQDE